MSCFPRYCLGVKLSRGFGSEDVQVLLLAVDFSVYFLNVKHGHIMKHLLVWS